MRAGAVGQKTQPRRLRSNLRFEASKAQILANNLKSTDLVAMGDAWKLLEGFQLLSIEPDLRNSMDEMLQKHYIFFHGDSFFDNELKEVMDISDAGFTAVQKNLFDAHKELLVWQAEKVGV
jgi:hypothetical protein